MRRSNPIFAVLFVVLATACAGAPTIAEDPELGGIAAKLARCRREGRDAGTYAAYEACKRREGLTEGVGQ